jgi:3-dehydrosphinganine reductase
MAFQFAWIALGIAATLCLSALWPKKPFMANLRGKHVFLTGASCGIGLAIARQALREGAYLTLVARNGEKMLEVAKSLLKELDCPAERLLVKVQYIRFHPNCLKTTLQLYNYRC